MAKVNYCDPSATYDGDGTTSAQAASNGAVGAWNSLRKAFTGTVTYGSLAAGDEVVIRSYNGANITVLDNSTLVFTTTGTAAAPITFRIDDGTVWAAGGTLTWSQTTAAVDITLGSNVIILADYDHSTFSPKMKFECPSTSRNDDWLKITQVYLDGVWFNSTGTTVNNQGVWVTGKLIANNCRFGNYHGGVYSAGIATGLDTSVVVLNNPTIDFKSIASVGNGFFRGHGSRVPRFTVNGGRCLNVVIQSRLGYSTASEECGLDIDQMDLNGCIVADDRISNMESRIASSDGECFYADIAGQREWQAGKNYPTLNAINSGGTAWSWRCRPYLAVTRGDPFKISALHKYYTSTAATRTFTANLCIKDTSAGSHAFDTMPERDCWAVYTYIDATTSESITVSSPITLSALTASSATWTPEVGGYPVYGANNYLKYELAVTTPTTVKQNTWIKADVYFARPRIYTDDYFFCDPEFEIA